MTTNDNTPIDAALQQYFDSSRFYATEATWINPHPSKAGTPVESGGLIWPADYGASLPYPRFDILFVSGNERKPVCGARKVNIIPLGLTKPSTILSARVGDYEKSVLVTDRLFIRKGDLPSGVSSRSAVAFFFVFEEDEGNEPVFILFKGHLSSMIDNSFSAYRRALAKAARVAFGSPIASCSIPVLFGAGDLVMVGSDQKSMVAAPTFWPKFGQSDGKEAFQNLLIHPARLNELRAYSEDTLDSIFISSRRRVARNLREAMVMLSSLDQESDADSGAHAISVPSVPLIQSGKMSEAEAIAGSSLKQPSGGSSSETADSFDWPF